MSLVLKLAADNFTYFIPYSNNELYGVVDSTLQPQATTLFFTSLVKAYNIKRISYEKMDQLIRKYLKSTFIINPIYDPRKTADLLSSPMAGSFAFLSKFEHGLILNYNILMFENYNVIYPSSSSTNVNAAPQAISGTLRVYSGTIYLWNNKVVVQQSLQIENDSSYTFTTSSPNIFNYCLDNREPNKKIGKTTPEQIKATLILLQNKMSQLLTNPTSVNSIKEFLYEETKNWETNGLWAIFPKSNCGQIQYLVGFSGKIKTTEGTFPLNFNIKLVSGSPIVETQLTVTGIPIYLGPLINWVNGPSLTNPSSVSIITTGAPVRPVFSREITKGTGVPLPCTFCNFRFPGSSQKISKYILAGRTLFTAKEDIVTVSNYLASPFPIYRPIKSGQTFTVVGTDLAVALTSCPGDSELMIVFSNFPGNIEACDVSAVLFNTNINQNGSPLATGNGLTTAINALSTSFSSAGAIIFGAAVTTALVGALVTAGAGSSIAFTVTITAGSALQALQPLLEALGVIVRVVEVVADAVAVAGEAV